MSTPKTVRPASDLEILRNILTDNWEPEVSLFSWQGDSYARWKQKGVDETLKIKTERFRARLARAFEAYHQRLPSSHALRTAISEACDRASLASNQAVFRRVGTFNDGWLIDLGREDGHVIEIMYAHWRKIEEVGIPFVRYPWYLPYKLKDYDGEILCKDKIDTLWKNTYIKVIERFAKLINLDSPADFQLLMSWCVCALTPNGPYPVLVVTGDQGSGKSTLVRLVRMLVDPSSVPLRALPSSEKELFIGAANSHLLAFDNVSTISSAMSDSLCRLSTGGAISIKRLGTEADEILLDAKAPIIINGIGDLVLRPDLADRTVSIKLTAVPNADRRELRVIMQEFESILPQLTEALFSLISLYRWKMLLPQDWKPSKLPRMSEFAMLGIAIEEVFGESGSFLENYQRNISRVRDDLSELDPILVTVLEIWDQMKPWRGTMQELQVEIAKRIKAAGSPVPPPKGLAQLSSHIKRIMPVLIANGVLVAFERSNDKDRRRTLHLF